MIVFRHVLCGTPSRSAYRSVAFSARHRAGRPHDRQHAFGQGRELHFWSFVVAIMIFAVGAGISFYEGYVHFIDPGELTMPTINYVVLAVAFLLGGASWAIAFHEFASAKGELSWWSAIRESKDPAVSIVMLEDSAALVGPWWPVSVCGRATTSTHRALMGVALMVIGVILALVAILLPRETRVCPSGSAPVPTWSSVCDRSSLDRSGWRA